jgi:LPS export ABC transporter permease LptF/LPS export ABC transporter permease LptG
MLRIIDRYLLREIVTPFILALLMLTFALEIPPIIQQGERLIAKGVAWGIITKVLLTLLPQALSITIPMALLIGTLIALGRLSGDREMVALEACGVSLGRLLRPLLVFAVLAMGATGYVIIVALPAANQAFREITFRLVQTMAESDVKPRIFFQDFPNVVIYARDVQPGVGWTNVVVADNSAADEPKVYLAKRGRILIDADRKSVQMVLEDSTSHSVKPSEPDRYSLLQSRQTIISIDPNSVFPREGPTKGDPEMTIAELKVRMAELQQEGKFPHNQIMYWQQKFSIPVACLVFSLVALGLGVSHRRDGKMASLVLGVGVVFVYYLLMYGAQGVAKAEVLPGWFAWLAMWVPNVVVGIWGIALITRRMISPERPFQIFFPTFGRKAAAPGGTPARTADTAPRARGAGVKVVIKISRFVMPRPSILDWYVLKQAARVSALAGTALLGLFYVSTFIDLSDHLFKGRASLIMIFRYMWLETPQFTYYIIPLGILIGALVTIGSLTKYSELTVMRACGISLYRTSAPLLLLALVGSVALFGLEERVLAYANRQADAVNDAIRGRLPRTYSLNRQWIAATNGNIYQYVYFESARKRLNGLSIYEFNQDLSSLTRRSYFSQATFAGDRETKGLVSWQGGPGWVRDFVPKLSYTSFTSQPVVLDGPGYFGSERPEVEQMSYSQLRDHVAGLRSSGFNVVPLLVALHRKLAFPFITLIMALIAVPFAVTTGRRGALYGIGAGIVLAILYWTAISVFAAIGSGGLMSPVLAAWAPNIIFGCAALYLLLTVRT